MHGIGVNAARIHQRQRMKSPVHQAVAIYGQQGFPHEITSSVSIPQNPFFSKETSAETVNFS